MIFGVLGGLLGATAVIAGAFATHALSSKLAPGLLQVFETGARYQLVHALALLAVAVESARRPRPALSAAGWLFTFGVVVFSGSLYVLALSGVRAWGAVTPFGGLGMIAGWLSLALAFLPARSGGRV